MQQHTSWFAHLKDPSPVLAKGSSLANIKTKFFLLPPGRKRERGRERERETRNRDRERRGINTKSDVISSHNNLLELIGYRDVAVCFVLFLTSSVNKTNEACTLARSDSHHVNKWPERKKTTWRGEGGFRYKDEMKNPERQFYLCFWKCTSFDWTLYFTCGEVYVRY
jgi:hypothetical protein